MKADAGGREFFSGFHFGMDDWGNGRLPSRSDVMTIARHFNAGNSLELPKSRRDG